MCDRVLNPIINFADVKVGDVLVPDGGFTCMREGTQRLVREDPHNGLYINCDDGKHFLDGQRDFNTGQTLVGFKRHKRRSSELVE